MAASAEPAIRCSALSKRYGPGPAALDDLTLAVARGTGFGLLGENGAGKTKLVRLVMGFIFPTGGAICSPAEARLVLVRASPPE